MIFNLQSYQQILLPYHYIIWWNFFLTVYVAHDDSILQGLFSLKYPIHNQHHSLFLCAKLFCDCDNKIVKLTLSSFNFFLPIIVKFADFFYWFRRTKKSSIDFIILQVGFTTVFYNFLKPKSSIKNLHLWSFLSSLQFSHFKSARIHSN